VGAFRWGYEAFGLAGSLVNARFLRRFCNTQPDELADIIPTPVIVHAGGKSVEITPIRVRELAAFSRAVQPIAADLAAGVDIASLLAMHADAVIDATAVGARVEREFVLDLGLDDLLDLAAAVLTVNADFFVRPLLPKITAGTEAMALKLAGLSLTPDSGKQDSAP
jgi:hypothetical protein